MLTKENRDEHFARAHFQLYVTHGLGQFGNWLTMKYDQLDRKEVVAALRYESVMDIALSRLRHLENQITELRQLMREAVLPEAQTEPAMVYKDGKFVAIPTDRLTTNVRKASDEATETRETK